jgi:hypothetical protein
MFPLVCGISILKDAFPDAFAEGRIDFDLLRELLGEAADDDRRERYHLTWNGKSHARRIAEAPPVGELRPCPDESIDWGYIGVLMRLEDRVALSMRKQSPGPAGGMMYALMCKDYPVEYKCIRREMEEGIRTSFDEFINMQVDHDHEAAQRQIEAVERDMQEEEKRRRREAELEQQWRELGGRS